MAPPRLYRLPHEQLVELLSEYRTDGFAFEEAWRRSVRPGMPVVMTNRKNAPERCVLWPTDSRDRQAWQAALNDPEVKEQFRRAYQRRPATSREQAAGLLVTVLLEVSDRRALARGMEHRVAVRSAA